jgi:hypothetical protein
MNSSFLLSNNMLCSVSLHAGAHLKIESKNQEGLRSPEGRKGGFNCVNSISFLATTNHAASLPRPGPPKPRAKMTVKKSHQLIILSLQGRKEGWTWKRRIELVTN